MNLSDEHNRELEKIVKESGLVVAYEKKCNNNNKINEANILVELVDINVKLLRHRNFDLNNGTTNEVNRELGKNSIEALKLIATQLVNKIDYEIVKTCFEKLFDALITNNDVKQDLVHSFFDVTIYFSNEAKNTKNENKINNFFFIKLLVATVTDCSETKFEIIQYFLKESSGYRFDEKIKNFSNKYFVTITFFLYYLENYYLKSKEQRNKLNSFLNDKNYFSFSYGDFFKDLCVSFDVRLSYFLHLIDRLSDYLICVPLDEPKESEYIIKEFYKQAIYWYIATFLAKRKITWSTCKFMFGNINDKYKQYQVEVFADLEKTCLVDKNKFTPNDEIKDIWRFNFNTVINAEASVGAFSLFEYIDLILNRANKFKVIQQQSDAYKKILIPNARESWNLACEYAEKIFQGFVTLQYRKLFVSMLHNSVELFIKQRMLDLNDYRVADIRAKNDGEPAKSYYNSTNLNDFFKTTDLKGTKSFSVKFNDLSGYQKDLFKDYYANNKANEEKCNAISNGISKLGELRNQETHFYIDEKEFMSAKEFETLINFMLLFYEIISNCGLIDPNTGSSNNINKPNFIIPKKYNYKTFIENNLNVKEIASFFAHNKKLLPIDPETIVDYLKTQNFFDNEYVTCNEKEAISLIASLILFNMMVQQENKAFLNESTSNENINQEVCPYFLKFKVNYGK